MRRLLLAIPLILTWGCFSPSYDGPGGFTCLKSNACPEGFECVGGLCVKEGTARDGSVDSPLADGPVADGLVADGPVADGPQADGPQADAPTHDGPTPDSPTSDAVKPDALMPDTAKPDGPAPDTLKPDTLMPDAPVPDAPVPDTLKPDTLKPDTLKPDAGPQFDAWPAPWCNISMAALQTVSTATNIHDIVVDSHGRAHLIFVDSAGLIYHLWNKPTGSAGGAWTYTQLAKTYTGDRIAAAIDSNDVIHVAFRNPADNHRPYYLYGAYSPATTTWSSPKQIAAEDQLGDSLDVAANGTNVFIAASRNTMSTSDFHLWKVNRSTNPYGLSKVWVQNLTTQTYEWGRLAAGPTHVATSFFDGTNYKLQATPVGGGVFVTKMVTGNSSGPAPVAAAGSNQILMAHVNTTGGLLHYEQWDGKSTSSVTHDSLTGSSADPYNLDIKGGGPGLAVLVYRKSSGSTPWPYLVTRTSSGWVTSPPKLVTAGKTDDLHMTINPSLKHAWIVFSVAGKLSVRCINY